VRTYTPVATPAVSPPPGKHRADGAHPQAELRAPVMIITPTGDHELEKGALLIGRLPECDVILNDGLVSRMHARLSVQGESVVIEDLHSTNGVFVNGRKVAHSATLSGGDRILIGTSELSLFESRGPSAVRVPEARASSVGLESEPPMALPPIPRGQRLGAISVRPAPPPAPPPEPSLPESSRYPDKVPSTARTDALQTFGALAERLAAMGNVDEAVSMLSGHLKRILKGANSGLTVSPEVAESASLHALRMARWTRLPLWVDYAVELHLSARLLMSITTLQAYEVASAAVDFDRLLLAYYVESLAAQLPTMSPAERVRVTHLASLVHAED
jgi:pSer/pThr/pTyr-binding forkhead associated (FHA) protein